MVENRINLKLILNGLDIVFLPGGRNVQLNVQAFAEHHGLRKLVGLQTLILL